MIALDRTRLTGRLFFLPCHPPALAPAGRL
jgi:hypothetical protein